MPERFGDIITPEGKEKLLSYKREVEREEKLAKQLGVSLDIISGPQLELLAFLREKSDKISSSK